MYFIDWLSEFDGKFLFVFILLGVEVIIVGRKFRGSLGNILFILCVCECLRFCDFFFFKCRVVLVLFSVIVLFCIVIFLGFFFFNLLLGVCIGSFDVLFDVFVLWFFCDVLFVVCIVIFLVNFWSVGDDDCMLMFWFFCLGLFYFFCFLKSLLYLRMFDLGRLFCVIGVGVLEGLIVGNIWLLDIEVVFFCCVFCFMFLGMWFFWIGIGFLGVILDWEDECDVVLFFFMCCLFFFLILFFVDVVLVFSWIGFDDEVDLVIVECVFLVFDFVFLFFVFEEMDCLVFFVGNEVCDVVDDLWDIIEFVLEYFGLMLVFIFVILGFFGREFCLIVLNFFIVVLWWLILLLIDFDWLFWWCGGDCDCIGVVVFFEVVLLMWGFLWECFVYLFICFLWVVLLFLFLFYEVVVFFFGSSLFLEYDMKSCDVVEFVIGWLLIFLKFFCREFFRFKKEGLLLLW